MSNFAITATTAYGLTWVATYDSNPVDTVIALSKNYHTEPFTTLSDSIGGAGGTAPANSTTLTITFTDSDASDFYPGYSGTIYAYRYIASAGNWYYVGSAYYDNSTLQPPASFSCEEHNGQINTFSVTHAPGATSTEFYYYWLDSQGVLAGYYDISVPSGTTSGEHNTGCPYNTTIYYNLRSYDGTNYSAWKDTVGNSYYFTSGSAPGLYAANGLTGNETGGRWHPSYLTNHWNTSYYQQAVISLDSRGSNLDGGSTAPSNILDTMNAPSSGTLHSPATQEYTTGLMPGTYYVTYCYIKAANGLWYYVGSDDFTTRGIAPTKLITPTLSFNSATSTSITLNIGTVTGGYYYDVRIYDNSYTYIGDSSTTGSSITFDHASFPAILPNTAYYFSISARPVSGSTVYLESNESGYYGAWSTINSTPETPVSEVVCTSVQDGGLSLSWGTSQYATSYDLAYWYLVDGTATDLIIVNMSGTSKALTGLNYGTTYYFNIRGVNSAGSSNWVSSSPPEATVRPYPPTISSGNITQTSVSITESGMSGRWATITVYQYESDGTTLKATGIITNGSSVYVDFTNLTAGNTYIFKAKSTVASDGGINLDSLSFSANLFVIATANNRPVQFNWTYAGWNVSIGAVTGTTKSNIYALYVTAIEWNALIYNVQLVWTYKGWGSTGLSYVSASTNMLASQFNVVKNMIGGRNATGIADKTANSSNIIYSDFNTLQTKLNGIT